MPQRTPPTALDIGTTDFDQPPPAYAAAHRRYLLCGTQRTGSTLLCRLLISAGIGVPHEYFNPRHVQPLQRAWGVGPGQGLAWLEALYRHRTTPNGAWGLKLQWPQFVQSVQWMPGLTDALFEGATLFQITRRDRHAQAVSLHLSLLTGVWGVRGVRTTQERSDIALGDPGHLRWCARTIAGEEARWQAFHAARHQAPTELVYEELVDDPVGTVGRIAAALGLGQDQWKPPPPEPREPRPAHAAAQTELLARLLARPELTQDA